MPDTQPPLTTNVDEAISRMTASAQRILTTLAPLTDEQLQRRPSPQDWSGAQLLAHTAEIMPYWTEQAVEVAGRSEDGLPFGRMEADPDRLAAVERGVGMSGAELRQAVVEGVDRAAAILRTLPPEKWGRTATHPRRGTMSITEALEDFLFSHLDGHANQAQAIAAAATS